MRNYFKSLIFQFILAGLCGNSLALAQDKKCVELFRHLNQTSGLELSIRKYYAAFLREDDSIPSEATAFFQGATGRAYPQKKMGYSTANDLSVRVDSYEFQKNVDDLRFSKQHLGTESEDYADWKKAHEKFVVGAKEFPIQIKTLQDIHAAVARNQYYAGFERRRVREAFRAGSLGENEAVDALMNIDRGISFTKLDHRSFAGKLRKDPLDSFVYTGEVASGNRIPREDFDGMSNNPFFWRDSKSVKKFPGEQYEARFYYVPPPLVEKVTKEVIERAAAHLEAAKTDEEYMFYSAALLRDLVTIHPFLDGNGRSIRLFIDMILAKRGLALPMKPLKDSGVSEYTDTLDSIARETQEQMRQWKKIRASP